MARLLVNLEAIRHNARLVSGLCARGGVELTLVTKGVLGDPVIVAEAVAGAAVAAPASEAPLAGAGIRSVADSRLENLRRVRATPLALERHLLRAPAPQDVGAVPALADVSYHSELEVIRALGEAAAARGVVHRVVLMVDVGDRREGLLPDDIAPAAARILGFRGVTLHGLGLNVGCVGGVRPTVTNTGLLAELAMDIEERFGHRLALVSGGSSTSLALLVAGQLPRGINHLRVGTAVWLGVFDTWDEPIPGARHDAFELLAPLIEVKWKPSLPAGEIGRDAFGHRPVSEDRGPMLRAICALGRQDVYVEGLQPRRPGWQVVAASSDHLILDVTAAAGPPPSLGEEVRFRLDYPALLSAMQSPGVAREYGYAPPSAGDLLPFLEVRSQGLQDGPPSL